jgi:hypothetical protein
MPRVIPTLLAIAGALAVVTACSKSQSNAAAQASKPVKAGAARASTGNACDGKLLTGDDVAGILRDPITGTEAIPGDPETCRFTTASFSSVMVTLRPGLGATTVKTWLSGRMPVPGTPLAGVGDEAAWVDELHEVVAEKNDLLCDIQVTGLAAALRSAPAAAQGKAIGALCNKIFGEAL